MTPQRGPMNLKPEAADRTQRSLERHGETNWYEWTLREFLRYLFGLGILALIVFVPLQAQLSWLPSNGPPVYDPTLVSILLVIALVQSASAPSSPTERCGGQTALWSGTSLAAAALQAR